MVGIEADPSEKRVAVADRERRRCAGEPVFMEAGGESRLVRRTGEEGRGVFR